MKNEFILFCVLLFLNTRSIAQKNKENINEKEFGVFQTTIPAQPYNIILSRPTDHAVSVNILVNSDANGFIQYGTNATHLTERTPDYQFANGQPTVVPVTNLLPDKRYYYRFIIKQANGSNNQSGEISYFHTQRSPKSSFTFTLQADSHLDENAGTAVYLQTLNNMAADSADFIIDLGDTWMTDKYRDDYKVALKQYIAQRYYFGSLCKSSPLFLTLGNHDGESGQQLKKKNTDNMALWATATRKKYYSNPFPDEFYKGNNDKENSDGYPENYYSWQWGNALFIVLDPFRYSDGNKNPWQRTLGDVQYKWLKNTLQNSKADFKFVFIHNLVGGVDLKGKGRGGAEAAQFFEWGGNDTTGINAFQENRPGWEKPIHELLLANKVNIVFHGHDHFFAKQDKDGIVYQLVPQPGAIRYGNTNTASEYGYSSGVIINNPGYMRIKIENKKATIDYLQTSIDSKHINKEMLYTYTIQLK